MNRPVVGTKVNCRITDRETGELIVNPNHISPFDIFCDLILDKSNYYVIWANRGGSKTYIYGGLDTFYKSITKPNYSTKILGGSEGQSQLSYDAMREFVDITNTEKELFKHPGLLKQSGNLKNGSKVSILTASPKSVRGPHTISLKLDEVDEIDPIIYEYALSIPQSKFGHPSVLGMFSTNHHVNGQMDLAIARAAKKGHKVYRYCVWECLEACVDFECSTCPLASFCPGEHMKEADGYYKIQDFIEKLNTLSWDSIQRDWLCIKTGRGDLVYQEEWDEEIHLVNARLNLSAPVYISVDFGGANPFSVGVWQEAPPELGDDAYIRVTEVFKAKTTNGKVIKECKKAPWWKNIVEMIPDPRRPDCIEEWEDEFLLSGLNVEVNLPNTDVDPGIENVKSALSPTLGNPKIFFNRICKECRREFASYKVKKLPAGNYVIVKAMDHTMDEIRYFVDVKIARGGNVGAEVLDHDTNPI